MQKDKKQEKKREKIQEKKRSIRKQYLQRRDAMDWGEQVAAGRKIKEKVLAMKQVKAAGTVFLYAAYKSEVPTKELLEKLLASGKRVALPKVDGSRMEFYEVSAWEKLLPGYHGILEPEAQGAAPVLPRGSDAMLLPGAAFDRRGGRIGYGRGYYDRYLQELEALGRELPYLAGICYQRQLLRGSLPLEPQDKRVNCIVTERKTIRAKEAPPKLGWLADLIEGLLEGLLEYVLDVVFDLLSGLLG